MQSWQHLQHTLADQELLCQGEIVHARVHCWYQRKRERGCVLAAEDLPLLSMKPYQE